MKNKIILYLLILIISEPLWSQDKLNDYLTIAAQHNAGLKAKYKAYEAALQKIPQVGALPDPQVAFGYFIQPVVTKNGSQQAKVSLSQMLPWFGTLKDSKNVFLLSAKSKYELFEEAKSKLYYEVKKTYFNLYFIKKNIKLSNDNLEILKMFKRLALIKVETGQASSVDVMRVELNINQIENNLKLLHDQLTAQKVRFKTLLNNDTELIVDIPDTLSSHDVLMNKAIVRQSMQTNNHQLKSLDWLTDSFGQKQKLAKKQALPKLLLGMDYIAIDNDSPAVNAGQNAIMFKIGFSIPINRQKNKARLKEAVLQQQMVSYNKVEKTNRLKSILEEAFKNYDDAMNRINLYKTQINLSKRALQILKTAYENNARNFEEVLRMNQQVLEYTVQLEKAQSDKQIAIAFINYLMGK